MTTLRITCVEQCSKDSIDKIFDGASAKTPREGLNERLCRRGTSRDTRSRNTGAMSMLKVHCLGNNCGSDQQQAGSR